MHFSSCHISHPDVNIPCHSSRLSNHQGKHYSVNCDLQYAVRSRYITAIFLQISHERHPIARPSGWAMGCPSWVQGLIEVYNCKCCVVHIIELYIATIYITTIYITTIYISRVYSMSQKESEESEILFDNINHHHTQKKSISFTVKYLYSIQYTWLCTEQFIIMPCSSNSNRDVVRGPHWGWIAAIMLWLAYYLIKTWVKIFWFYFGFGDCLMQP